MVYISISAGHREFHMHQLEVALLFNPARNIKQASFISCASSNNNNSTWLGTVETLVPQQKKKFKVLFSLHTKKYQKLHQY